MSGFKIALVVIVIPLMLAGTPVAAQDSGGNGNRAKQGEVNPEPDSETPKQGEAKPEANSETPKRPILGRNRIIDVQSIGDLFNAPRVAEELKLSPETHKTIIDAVSESTPNMTTLRNQLRNANSWMANGTGTQETLDQARATLEAVEAKRADAVRTRLSRTQYKRLLQIAIQQHGYRALVTPDVASAVGLSLEQEQRIKAILDNRESERAAFVRRLQDRIPPADEQRYNRILQKEISRHEVTADEKAFMKKWFAAKTERVKRVETFEDEIDSRIFSVLRCYQKNRFYKLLGDPVEVEGPREKKAPNESKDRAKDSDKSKNKQEYVCAVRVPEGLGTTQAYAPDLEDVVIPGDWRTGGARHFCSAGYEDSGKRDVLKSTSLAFPSSSPCSPSVHGHGPLMARTRA